MNFLKSYFSFLVLILVSATNLFAQSGPPWVDISLNSTNQYIEYSVHKVFNDKYPAQNIFDGNLQTCWVSNSNKGDEISYLYLKLPELSNWNINIFPGYGKSENLFRQNARPKKLRFSFYVAVNPEGYVTEISTLYKAVKIPYTQLVDVSDSFEIQSFKLNIPELEISKYKKIVQNRYNSELSTAQSSPCLILKIEILDIYNGTKYSDICISEIFLNDCLISFHPITTKGVKSVYLNSSENSLLVEDDHNKGTVVYSDTWSVLQIVDVSEDKQWAIILSMPASNEGRTATTYLLVDLMNKKIVNSRIEEIASNYSWGVPVFFESVNNDILYLIYANEDGRYSRIKLR